MEERANMLASEGGVLFWRSILTYLLGLGLGGILQIVLTIVSIAVGIMAFKHYRLSNELKSLEIASIKAKTKSEERDHLKVV